MTTENDRKVLYIIAVVVPLVALVLWLNSRCEKKKKALQRKQMHHRVEDDGRLAYVNAIDGWGDCSCGGSYRSFSGDGDGMMETETETEMMEEAMEEVMDGETAVKETTAS